MNRLYRFRDWLEVHVINTWWGRLWMGTAFALFVIAAVFSDGPWYQRFAYVFGVAWVASGTGHWSVWEKRD